MHIGMSHCRFLEGGSRNEGRGGKRTASRCVVGGIVVFREHAGAILGAEDYDGIHREQGHAGRHGCGVGWLHTDVWGLCDMEVLSKSRMWSIQELVP
jgi:hypothetical protein